VWFLEKKDGSLAGGISSSGAAEPAVSAMVEGDAGDGNAGLNFPQRGI
jgi:hypothetical protein